MTDKARERRRQRIIVIAAEMTALQKRLAVLDAELTRLIGPEKSSPALATGEAEDG